MVAVETLDVHPLVFPSFLTTILKSCSHNLVKIYTNIKANAGKTPSARSCLRVSTT